MRETEPPLTIVEFFGAPGAGKSTLARAVAARVRSQTRHELSAKWHHQPALTKARFICLGFARPDRVIGAARLALRCRLRNRPSIARLVRVIAKNQWLRAQRGLVLLDQGFLQDLWSVLSMGRCDEPDPENLSPFLRSIYPMANTRIVFVDVDPKTAFERISGRSDGHSVLDRLPEAERRSSIERTAQLPHRILDGAAAAGLQIIRLDGSEEIEKLAQHILSLLPSESHSRRRISR